MKGLESSMDEVKSELSKPVPDHGTITKEKRMATKVDKKAAKAETNGKEDAKAAKKPAKGGKAAKADEDGNVTLASLASEAGISAAAARRKIRATEMERDGRWSFKDGSKQLRTAREALGLS